jgi:CspA family cold shock protein
MTCFLKTGPLPKQKGEVKWFDPRRRYGFIVTKEGHDVFVHENQLLGSVGSRPREGQKVRFHVQRSSEGREALNVELL